jgi:hypothetical protein
MDGEFKQESALSSLRVDSLVKERMAYGIEFISSPSVEKNLMNIRVLA